MKIDLCIWYDVNHTFLGKCLPKCLKGRMASLKCHSRNRCPNYHWSLDEPIDELRKEILAGEK